MTKNKRTSWRFYRVYTIFLVVVFIIVFSRVISGFEQAKKINEVSFYPKDAVIFLQKQSLNGELFSLYEWGGYLIWKLPQKKVFVDGRMPSQRWKAPIGESDWAFDEYRQIVFNRQPFEQTFEKYNILYVLWNKPTKKKDWMDKLVENISFSLIPKNEANPKRLNERLADAGWKLIYEDHVSQIWQKQVVR